MEGLVVLLFLIGPAMIGIGALVGGIVLLRRKRRADTSDEDLLDATNPRWTPLWAALLLALAFGIATCYAIAFLPNLR